METTDITIKKDGKWYFKNAEMFRRNIVNVLATHLERKEDGIYIIRLGQDTSEIHVEDVPFLAQGIVENEDGSLVLVFHDLQEFPLENEVRLYLKGDVPYITFRWEADTRLSRGVYWKLSDLFEFRGDEIYIIPPQGKVRN